MQKTDFYFDLPQHLIAQSPAHPRDTSRLLRLNRQTGEIGHYIFNQLPTLLKPGDLLVANNSKVLPARLLGEKKGSGGACELLLLKQHQHDQWECLARPGRRMQTGTQLVFGDGSLTATVQETLLTGNKLVHFTYDTTTLYEKLEQFGKMPLPPYIRSQISNNSDYQTVYAKQPGSAAAPTAGLHFTDSLINQLAGMGVGLPK